MSSARGRGRGRSRGGEEEEHENKERWLVSYSDMMTVLVALFIVLYAMSQVDIDKFNELRTSLAAGFGAPQVSILTDGAGVMPDVSSQVTVPTIDDIIPVLSKDIAAQAGMTGSGTATGETIAAADLAAARAEYANLDDLATRIDEALRERGLEGALQFRINERGLIIGMVTDEVFFAAESAVLTETSQIIVDTLAPYLVPLPNEISVEGHANSVPTTSKYTTNWELSSDRATQVLRRLVEVGALPGVRAAAVGFGDARPLLPNDTPEGLAGNRRVDLVVLSDKPERIRELLPLVPTLEEG
ncbi:chemotaxis protein MotB [Sanguibacter gelidistatuariae]|uniref:Chemotaxis protein MotB n=1 Tax=Sanguibacter gelidistatuariae TaxID=1814289 RepID=A0A1G6PXQ4_9MICO|nr:flagellar motor protein MotB [Sanguibacter gelidistatuariae]SDC84982.1 chemotaxis protein MotB [Sanguibacter gelidistatuariae]